MEGSIMDIITYALLKNKMAENAGLSAYELAVKHGFVGTEEEWLKSLGPTIGENGNWVVGGEDTGVSAGVEPIAANIIRGLFGE